VFQIMLSDHGGDNDVLTGMIESLDMDAGQPPTKRVGVPDSYLDELERVSKAELKRGGKEEVCPICSEPFLDGGSCVYFSLCVNYAVLLILKFSYDASHSQHLMLLCNFSQSWTSWASFWHALSRNSKLTA
jgi:hypothetical protein